MELRALLKQALPPVDGELRRDLWPRMLDRLGTNVRRVPWFDWALAGAVACWLIFYPGTITLLLYHL